MGITIKTAIKNIYGIASPKAAYDGRSNPLPAPIKMGSDIERTKPTITAAIKAPLTEPSVPRTITEKAGRSILNPTSGLTLTYIPNNTPPKPDMPAAKNAVIACTRSTLIPDDAAKSGLSATARICLPNLVLLSININKITAPNTPIINADLVCCKKYDDSADSKNDKYSVTVHIPESASQVDEKLSNLLSSIHAV